MMKHIFSICIVMVFLGVGPAILQLQAQTREGTQFPIQESYYHIFLHLSALNKKAGEAESHGENGNRYRSLVAQAARLNSVQAQQLNAVAADCLSQVKSLDDRAQELMQTYRQSQQDGTGMKRPLAELQKLEDDRTVVLLKSRAQLQALFGEAEFARFESFVSRNVRSAAEKQPRKVKAHLP